MNRQNFEVRAFYGRLAPSPKQPGQKAFHTWNAGAHSRDMEVQAASGRADIGKVETRVSGGSWAVVYVEPAR